MANQPAANAEHIARYEALIRRFGGYRVLVVGDVYLDENVDGVVTGVSLEAPIAVYEVQRKRHNPGAAGNAACNLAALGAKTYMVGVVGDDVNADIVRKEFAVELSLRAGAVRIGGMSKGAGMIAPNMATTIAVVTTDATLAPAHLEAALRRAVDVSFNAVCVDNDMSTSDTLLVLANGAAGLPALAPDSDDFRAFEAGLQAVCMRLAQALVRDGEGVTKFVEIQVEGAPTDADARTIARAVAKSDLVKTAFYGEDPNWGRIACAAGYSGVTFDPEELAIWLGPVKVLERGAPTDYEEADAAAVMKKPEYVVRIAVGNGPGRTVFWTSDLTLEYIRINADYRS